MSAHLAGPTIQVIQLSETPQVEHVPDGLTLGRPIRIMAPGTMHSRRTGAQIVEVTSEHLDAMVMAFEARSVPSPGGSELDPVVIDWQHASTETVPPETGGALGRVVRLMVRGGALYAVPAYTPRGRKVVDDAAGVLWSSPEFSLAAKARDTGKDVGPQLIALTLTPRPQQTGDRVDPVRLSEARRRGGEEDPMADQDPTGQEQEPQAAPEDIKTLAADVDTLKKDVAEIKEMISKLAGVGEEGENAAGEGTADDKDDAEKPEDKEVAASEGVIRKLSEVSSELAGIKTQLANTQLEKRLTELVAERRIAPAERDTAAEVFRMSEKAFEKIYGARQAGAAGPELGARGRGGHLPADAPKNRTEHDSEIVKLSESGKIPYAEADRLYRTRNPDAYAAAFDVEG